MEIKRNPRGFGYLVFYAGSHDHIRTRVWVHRSLIEPGPNPEDERRPFPARDAWIYPTKKGSLVMRPCPGGVVYQVGIVSGYRGGASIRRIAPEDAEVIAQGSQYHSPRGATGETAWALVNARGPIEIFAHRTGRRVDQTEFAFRLTPDGEKEELVEDTELCEMME